MENIIGLCTYLDTQKVYLKFATYNLFPTPLQAANSGKMFTELSIIKTTVLQHFSLAQLKLNWPLHPGQFLTQSLPVILFSGIEGTK